MSSLAKQAREAMKAKASRLTTADPHQKVDSSNWTPAEPLNTEVKTGLRPVSRRAFKSGGKVTGAKSKANLGKKARNSGGKAITADSLINRNVKEANEERPGGKAHIGGYKKGGRLKRNAGGDAIKDYLDANPDSKPESVPLPPPRPKNLDAPKPEKFKSPYDLNTQRAKRGGKAEKCWGGKAKKADGGSLDAAKQMMMQAQKTAGVPSSGIYGSGFTRTGAGSMSPAGALGKQKLKKGGAAHEDVKADMALIKKMVKPSAMRKGRAGGGMLGGTASTLDPVGTPQAIKDPLNLGKGVTDPLGIDKPLKRGGRTARKEGGGVFSGPGYPGKVPGVVGGRQAHATRGRVKTADDIAAEYAMRGPDEAMQSIVHGGLPPGEYKASGQSAMRPQDWEAVRNSMYDDAMRRSLMDSSRNNDLMYLYDKAMSGAQPSMSEYTGAAGASLAPEETIGMDMARRHGGRTAHAKGGKAKGKGKTHINIMIAAGKPGMGDMMPPGGPTPPPGMDGGPGGIAPVPMAPPPGGAPGAPMPMPIPMPMPMAGGAPAGGPPPVGRKSGGRLTKVAHSYKDMEAGAGSGEGRLQKTDIAKFKAGRKAGGKVGHRTYRSYKDMDAGAGSGFGRLEKAEIQSRKK
ncbi:MAG: hypothetical protein AMJ56_00390 [Anaerolineae bacterium SG8_19]|nr:MAG: hypothetical protein AMJ56_00390 [Anaerolineae bacterium SG8_19]